MLTACVLASAGGTIATLALVILIIASDSPNPPGWPLASACGIAADAFDECAAMLRRGTVKP